MSPRRLTLAPRGRTIRSAFNCERLARRETGVEGASEGGGVPGPVCRDGPKGLHSGWRSEGGRFCGLLDNQLLICVVGVESRFIGKNGDELLLKFLHLSRPIEARTWASSHTMWQRIIHTSGERSACVFRQPHPNIPLASACCWGVHLRSALEQQGSPADRHDHVVAMPTRVARSMARRRL